MGKNRESFILIVDDNPKNLQVLGNILREKKHKTAIAKTGFQALKLVEKKHPDLILLDVMMPEMDGFEVCQRLKEKPHTKDIPVIFISALTDTSEKLKGFKSGGVDYITKPFQQEEVFARVDVHLKLQKSQEALKAANAAKDKLFSIIAHDLRAPIGTLIPALELMVEKPEVFDHDDKKEILAGLFRSTKRAYNLLENLLYWARSQRGDIDYQPEIIDISEMVDDAMNLFSSIAHEKSISLVSRINSPVYAYADEEMIRTVVRNLISNALKFTPEYGDVQIGTDIKGDFVELSCMDNGVGISRENQTILFDSNEHLSTFGTENEKGSGLGLMLCKEFVRKNGGDITVDSTEGDGSTFKVTIPTREIRYTKNS